jgi:hypothetical protein
LAEAVLFNRQVKSVFATRQRRMILYLAILLGVAGWKYIPRPWFPTTHLETTHYAIASSATQPQTEEIGRVVEQLYLVYSNQFHSLPVFQTSHSKLQMKLYKDRKQFRHIHPNLGWAEAFYRKPYCQAYYSASEINPYHWMLHESIHQFNEEVAHLDLVKWLEEGLAEYFSTSRYQKGQLKLGHIDPNTYPTWWIDIIATTPSLKTNLQNGSVIPLRSIISGRGGPSMSRNVNLYYLHWWSLTHFVFESTKYRERGPGLLVAGGGVEAFEKAIGPIEQVQVEWHQHVRRIKTAVAGHDPKFFRDGQLPEVTD